MNANLLFNWRRSARAVAAAGSGASAEVARLEAGPSATEPCEFVPIGVFARADDEGPAFATGAASAPARATAALSRPGLQERAGAIEIELGNGTRLRVDAFVNERALRRVLAAVKATS